MPSVVHLAQYVKGMPALGQRKIKGSKAAKRLVQITEPS
jgi:hypothetical protein